MSNDDSTGRGGDAREVLNSLLERSRTLARRRLPIERDEVRVTDLLERARGGQIGTLRRLSLSPALTTLSFEESEGLPKRGEAVRVYDLRPAQNVARQFLASVARDTRVSGLGGLNGRSVSEFLSLEDSLFLLFLQWLDQAHQRERASVKPIFLVVQDRDEAPDLIQSTAVFGPVLGSFLVTDAASDWSVDEGAPTVLTLSSWLTDGWDLPTMPISPWIRELIESGRRRLEELSA